jgi:hypothetical protein
LTRIGKIVALDDDRPVTVQDYELPPLHRRKLVAKNDSALA